MLGTLVGSEPTTLPPPILREKGSYLKAKAYYEREAKRKRTY